MARHLYLTLDLKRFELWHDMELHNMGQIFVICNMEISDCGQSLMWPEMTLTKPSENITISIALSTRQSWLLGGWELRCGPNSWQLNIAQNHLYESLWLAVAGEVAARDAATMLIPFVISSIGENETDAADWTIFSDDFLDLREFWAPKEEPVLMVHSTTTIETIIKTSPGQNGGGVITILISSVFG